MNILVLITSCLFVVGNPQINLTSVQQIAVLQEAQLAYDNGISMRATDPIAAEELFRRSSDRFQLLVDNGLKNGKLLYNLGNAYLQSGQIGKSIAAYRSAERYIPTDGRLIANLQYARTLVSNPIKGNETTSLLKQVAFLHYIFPTHVRLTACIVIWIACWCLISTRLFARIQYFKTVSITLGCIAIAFGVSVGADIMDQRQDHGVIVAEEVIVRKGNGSNYAPMFQQPVSEGIEFTIIEERRDWLHIRLPNGLQGWIQEEDAQIVSPNTTSKQNHSYL